jgi:hypothetical protein
MSFSLRPFRRWRFLARVGVFTTERIECVGDVVGGRVWVLEGNGLDGRVRLVTQPLRVRRAYALRQRAVQRVTKDARYGRFWCQHHAKLRPSRLAR